MDLFNKLRQRIITNSPLPRLDSSDISALTDRHRGLPADYLQFLTEVGYGDLGEVQLHSGPSAAESIYSAIPESLKSVLVFGDDKQGYCFGFDKNDGFRVVEVSPTGKLQKMASRTSQA